MLRRGLSNAQLELELGAAPPHCSEAARAAAARTAAAEKATEAEAAPFEARLRWLLGGEDGENDKVLRTEARACREALLAFAHARAGAFAAMLTPLAEARPLAAAAPLDAGGDGAVALEPEHLGRGPASAAVMVQAGVRLLAAATTYRVVHGPFVFVRAAPSTDAEVLSMADVGACLTVDAECRGWVRTAALPCALPDSKLRAGGWVLVDGAALGLGVLLEPVSA